MSVDHVEFIVEEPSMKCVLEGLLPRLLGPVSFAVFGHQGKRDLLDKLEARLRGSAARNWPGLRVVVVVDRDDDDCLALKRGLEQIAADAGLVTRSRAGGGSFQVVTRIAIEELEAWYFGDWQAVCTVFPRLDNNFPKQARYRHPDAITGGTWEAFERLLRQRGYYKTGLRKMEAATTLVRHMDPRRNTSPSFRAFAEAVRKIASGSAPKRAAWKSPGVGGAAVPGGTTPAPTEASRDTGAGRRSPVGSQEAAVLPAPTFDARNRSMPRGYLDEVDRGAAVKGVAGVSVSEPA